MAPKYFARVYLLIMLPIFLFSQQAPQINENQIRDSIESHIQLAENYYMLMLDEGIGTSAQKKSEKFIKESEDLLVKSTLSQEDKTKYKLQIETIRKELGDYLSVKYNTLDGYFPLIRYTASSFFFSPEEAELHTLMKNPDFIAVKNASKSLIESLGGTGEVVFNSIPQNSALEKIAFSIFNENSSASVHMDKDVVSVLHAPELIAQFRENNISDELASKLFEAFSGNPLYVATIEKQLSDKTERFYSFDAKYYDDKGYSSEKSVSGSGYAIDERSTWVSIIGLQLLFFAFALLFAYFHEKNATIKIYSMTLLFFLFGRLFPLIMVPTILSFKPDGDIHVVYGSWWVILTGIIILVLPIIAIKMFYGKVVDYLPLPDIAGKGELVGFSVAAGTLAFLTVPYIFGLGNTLNATNIVAFAMLSLAILFSGYIMGKVLDDNDKMEEKNLIVFVLTSGLLIAAFLHGVSIYLALASVFAIIIAGIILLFHRKKIKKILQEETKLKREEENAFDIKCDDIDSIDIRKTALNPPYQKFEYYQEVMNKTEKILEGKTIYTVLKGDGGAGKTATANVLLDVIGAKLSLENKPVIFLSSACERHNGDEVAYSVFHGLLDSTLGMDLFGQREKDEKFNNAMTMASKFLMGPVASFMAGDDSEQNAFSKNDIYIFVKKKLLELSKESTLIIYIDDLQWIDSASKELLKFIMSIFEPEADKSVLFLFTARDTEEGNRQINDLGLVNYAYSIGYIDSEEQRTLLERSFCIAPASRKWIINWVSEQNSDKIYPYILVDAVGNLARSDQFEIKNGSFAIKEAFDFDNPPIPDGPQREVEQFMQGHPEYTEILSLASLFGKEFHVSSLAYGLDLSYLECVKMLDTVSEESGLIFDALDKDDIYQFRSQIILDAIRSYIKYSNEGIRSTHVSQAIRHLHALSARSLEEKLKEENSSQLIMAIANHYYAAGKLHTDKTVEYALQAAKSCRKLFQYEDGLSFLDKADEVLMFSGKELVHSKELRLLIECDQSNVYGVDADKAATGSLAYIEENLDCNDELKIATVRACYDAGAQKGSQEWFAKAVEFSRAYLLASGNDMLQAEGNHFIGISLNPRDPEQGKQRFAHLEKAVDLTRDKYPMVYAKIANSLAEALSYGDDVSKGRAAELFKESLAIKENAEIKDLPGIARTYGGLGRLAFFSSPPKIDAAREYFKKDLEIAEEINDQRGISQMNSFLGSCSKSEDKYEDAIAFYEESIQMQNNPFDVHASYEGKFFSLAELNNTKKFIDAAKEYEKVLEKIGTPPGFLAKSICTILEKYNDEPVCQNMIKSLQTDE